MEQSEHTAINWLSRGQIQQILEDVCGTACYDDEPTDDLRECLRDEAAGTDDYAATVRAAIRSA